MPVRLVAENEVPHIRASTVGYLAVLLVALVAAAAQQVLSDDETTTTATGAVAAGQRKKIATDVDETMMRGMQIGGGAIPSIVMFRVEAHAWTNRESVRGAGAGTVSDIENEVVTRTGTGAVTRSETWNVIVIAGAAVRVTSSALRPATWVLGLQLQSKST